MIDLSRLQISTLVFTSLAIATPAAAQIVPDNTLPQNSTVILEDNSFQIQGGTPAGNNLFHSFEEFSVPENFRASFENISGIDRIFSRVTGNNISQIDGILAANGSASLFFINPNGIIFGENAQLQLDGSFVATTADSVRFADGTAFDARQPSPLLSVTAPTGLQFGATPGSITNTSQFSPEGFANSVGLPLGLTVAPNNSFILAGGDLEFETGNVTSFGGRIELGSVSGEGTVSLSAIPSGYRLGYDGVEQFGSIRLSGNSVIDTSGRPPGVLSPADPGSGGGAIQIQAGQLFVENSGITSSTFGGQGGTFTVTADTIDLSGSVNAPIDSNPIAAGLFSQTGGVGNAGNLNIEVGQLTIREGAQISTGTQGDGRGSNLSVSANHITVEGVSEDQLYQSSILSQVQPAIDGSPATGRSGDVTIQTRELFVRDGGLVETSTFSLGNAGNLTIDADLVEVTGVGFKFDDTPNPAHISALSESLDLDIFPPETLGQPGTLTLNAQELRVSDRAEVTALNGGVGFGGSINVNVDLLTLETGGQISANTVASGNGGNLTVTATESIDLIGTSTEGDIPSGLFVQSQNRIQVEIAGDSGNLHVSTGRLTVRDGAAIAADTFAAGNGGNVTVNASESIQVSGRSSVSFDENLSPNLTTNPTADADGLLTSRITARAIEQDQNPELPLGTAGNVTVNTPFLTIENLAQVSVSADIGSPLAGNVTLRAEDVRIENGGRLTGEAASGQGGNLNILEADDVRFLENADVSTTSGQLDRPGTGGNITIRTDTLVGLENSNISANAFNGSGGFVQITADDIVLGLENLSRAELEEQFGEDLTDFDPAQDSRNLITAISLTDPELSGTVEIVAPDVDPTQGVVELEDRFAEAPLDRNPCQIGGGDSEFVQTGRGGVPPTPNDALSGSQPWEDIRSIPLDETDDTTDESNPQPEIDRIVEAQGWIIDENGNLQLLPAPQPSNNRFQQPQECEPKTNKSNLANLTPGTVPETMPISGVTLEGSTVLEPEAIDRILNNYRDRPLRFADIQQAADELSQLYRERGYITSGVYVPPQTSRDGTLILQASESRFEDIDISVDGRLNPSYIRSRLGVEPGDLVNQTQLLQTLQLLQLDDRIDTLAAELAAGVRPETNRLSLNVKAASPLNANIRLDNNRSPSVGTFRQLARLQFNSLLGFGDTARVSYARTDGSDEWGIGYSVPITPSGGTVSFSYDTGANEVVESGFRSLDIEADSRQYDLTLRQPLFRAVEVPGVGSQRNRVEEFAIGFTASRRESQTSILGYDFPLSPGAEEDGETKISALRFFQDWTQQGSNHVFAARSEFSVGVNWFDATTHDGAPDSEFFAWRGQTQWVRRLENVGNSLLVVRGDVQLTPDALVPFEQMSLGGQSTARGYRQDALLADNGILGSVELRVPVLQIPQWEGQLDIVPFVDAGVVWNSDDRNDPERNTLVSAGLGLRFRLGDRLRLAFDWGIPFMDLEDRGDSWQEEGLYFSIESRLF
ncbi:two-partner secretion domain-containing protein [Baaleninema simplex]|uniref:two-partner secretion domain-containing protein n=1 Tax=Baaleninema simplex TaxID=2862350 RepID=UPI000347E60E|nr:ShlB/FhaC/HecB family hemolysin secretion/activation protein [Baaleninema simplex]